jgi:hypothetical protein
VKKQRLQEACYGFPTAAVTRKVVPKAGHECTVRTPETPTTEKQSQNRNLMRLSEYCRIIACFKKASINLKFIFLFADDLKNDLTSTVHQYQT